MSCILEALRNTSISASSNWSLFRCYDEYSSNGIATSVTEEKHDIQARKVTERVSDTLSGFTSIFSGPLSAVKDLARPAYWIPDEEIVRQA